MGERLSGGDMIIRALQDEGVDYIFGYPGGSALHIYDAIFRQQKVDHVLVRHEQAATHMADAYARATGRVGVVLVTSGPGATNAVTGIATAFTDSIPIVVISGQVASGLVGTDAFQETDMTGISRAITKHTFVVRSTAEIPMTVRKAFHVASTGRPGPVLIDVPKDMTDPVNPAEYVYPAEVQMRAYHPPTQGDSGLIRKAAKTLLGARRPIIYCGGGVILGEACELLIGITRLLNFPITTTLMALGAYPASDRQCVGMLGMHGTYEANSAMHHADVILAIGVRFDDRVTNNPAKFCPDATVIHIDVDPSSISKIITADIPIVGHVGSVLEELKGVLEEELERDPDQIDAAAIKTWWEQIAVWRDSHGLDHNVVAKADPDRPIRPQHVIQAVYAITGGTAYVTSDVGQHQMFAAQYYLFEEPRRWINSGGLGTMGFGLPAAMGVQMAFPDERVVCFTGEGSFMMNLQELSTCLQYRLPIKIICLNNQALGMVKQWQDMRHGGRHSHSTYQDSLPDFVELVKAFGHVGIRVDRVDELQPALERTFGPELKDRLVFVDIAIDPDEHVYPMAIAGGAMDEMIFSRTAQV